MNRRGDPFDLLLLIAIKRYRISTSDGISTSVNTHTHWETARNILRNIIFITYSPIGLNKTRSKKLNQCHVPVKYRGLRCIQCHHLINAKSKNAYDRLTR